MKLGSILILLALMFACKKPSAKKQIQGNWKFTSGQIPDARMKVTDQWVIYSNNNHSDTFTYRFSSDEKQFITTDPNGKDNTFTIIKLDGKELILKSWYNINVTFRRID